MSLTAVARRLLSLLRYGEDAALVTILAAIILLAGAQIVLRNLMGMGLVWIDPLLRVLVLWLGLLGALVATREDRHIVIDLVTRWVGPRTRRVLTLLSGLFAAAVCALVAWHGTRLLLFELEDGIAGVLGVPNWAWVSVIPVSFGLMALRFLLQALTGALAAEERAEPP